MVDDSLDTSDSLYAVDLLADLTLLESRPVPDLGALQMLSAALARLTADRLAVLGRGDMLSAHLPGLAADLEEGFSRVRHRVEVLASSPAFHSELLRSFLVAVYQTAAPSSLEDPCEELVLLPDPSIEMLHAHLLYPRTLRRFADAALVVLRRSLRMALQDRGMLAEPVGVDVISDLDVLDAAVTLWSPEAHGSPMESFTVALAAARRLL